MKLELSIQQAQHLSAQQIQSMALLQMSAAELQEHLGKAALENPLLEIRAPRPARQTGLDAAAGAPAPERQETLYEYVLEAARSRSVAPPLLEAVDFAAQGLDERGYLAETPREMAALSGLPEPLLTEAVAFLRSLSPAGIAARDLGDCLCLQLSRRTENTALARRIASCYLERLSRGQLGYIARDTGTTEAQVSAALAQIRACDPRPCRAFAPPADNRILLPDILLRREGRRLKAVLASDRLPTLSLNGEYLSLLHTSSDEHLRTYLSARLKEARFLLRAIESRQETLLRCAEVIAERQRAFFLDAIPAPASLTMAEVAGALDIHVSTVSRAVRDKYLQCDQGLFPMRYFFSRALGDASAAIAKKRITQLITGEDKARPLSDQRLSNILAAENIAISRRAVAKYRAQLGIPPAAGRKK